MRYSLCVLLILMLAICGCSGSQAVATDAAGDPELEPLLGSSLDGVGIQRSGAQCLLLQFDALPPEGKFLRLVLPARRIVVEEEWRGDDYVLHVVGNAPEGPEIGVRPVDGYQGSPVAVKLRTVAGERAVSVPPSGPWNAVMDLEMTYLGGGRIRLEWTEVNTGDYNFNSLVGVDDLTPLGVNFQSTYDPLIDGTFDNTLYWVDGNRDGLIGISDITPIGQHFGSMIIGYNVLRNGVVVHAQPGDLVTVSREEAETQFMLPPRYRVEFDGLPEDEWSVAPVDPDGVMGTNSAPASLPFKADLQVDLTIEGLDLFDLDGSGESGGLGFSGRSLVKVVDPGEILRRIAEGDVPNLASIGESADEDTPTPRFYGLPREQALALLVMYAPVVDLADGSPKTGSSARQAAQAISIEHETTVVPFRLPAGTDTSTLEVDIALTENPGGGYFTDVATEFTDGEGPTIASVRLNNLDRLIAMDNDGDDEPGLEYADEAQLADPDTLAISDRRLERGIDADDYGDPAEVLIYGYVDGWDEGLGTLELRLVHVNHPVTGWSHPPSLTVLVSEDSDFVGPDDADLEPSSLAVDDFVVLDAELLRNAALEPADKYWLRELLLVADPQFEPIPILQVDPRSGPTPLTVTCDGSQSFDPDGSITKYEIDFGEGMGWVDLGLTAITDHTYAADGNYMVRLQVTDNATPVPQIVTSSAITVNAGGPPPGNTVTVTVTVNFNGFQGGNVGTLVKLFEQPGDVLVDQIFQLPTDGVPSVLTFENLDNGTYEVEVNRIVTNWTGFGDVQARQQVTVPPDAGVSFVGEQLDDPPPPG